MVPKETAAGGDRHKKRTKRPCQRIIVSTTITMPTKEQTDSQWKKDLENLARKKVNLRGKKPPPSKKNFVAIYDKITQCPVWKNDCKPLGGGLQSTLFGAVSTDCNCGYSEYHDTP